MSQARMSKPMTPDEFFVWQADQDMNYELVDGLPMLTPKAMTGASRRHDRITVNIIATLMNQLRGTPCRPYTDDIAIRNPSGNVRRPDILVDCQRGEDRSTEIVEPRVLVEILFPSTARVDLFQKVEEYKAHPLVRVILLVDSHAARLMVWRRGNDAGWKYEIVDGLGSFVDLPEIGATLALADVYEDTGVAGAAEEAG